MNIASNVEGPDSATTSDVQVDANVGLRASIVLPTRNRCTSLVKVLRALANQSVSPSNYEVVVVADGCDDQTVSICSALRRELPYTLHLIEQSNAGPAVARNRAIQESNAPLIVFVDDDVMPGFYWLETHLAVHSEQGDDSVVAIGPLLPPTDVRLNPWGAWEETTLCRQYEAMHAGEWQPTYRQLYTGNASVTRRRLIEAGLFDPQYRRAEDIELGFRLQRRGCHFVFLHEAQAWHYVERTFASWILMPVAYGKATVMMGRTHGPVAVENAASEYLTRSLFTCLCVRSCLGSKLRTCTATRIFGVLAVTCATLRVEIAARVCCALVYNLLYYDGLSQELGGASAFWQLVKVARRDQRSGIHRELPMAVAETLGRPSNA